MPAVKASDFLSKVSFSGFGSLGGIGTDTDVIGYYRDIMQKKAVDKSWGATTDSRLGLQFDIAFNQQFHFTTQWIARDHAGNFFEQNLELAFIRWSPRSDMDLRVGRLNIDSFLLSDHKDISYAYPWMRPPHEFYAYLPGSHFDGADFSKHYRIGDSFLKLKVYAGNSHSTLREAVRPMNLPLVGVNISYSIGNWRTKINYTYARILDEGVDNAILDTLNNPELNQIFPDLNQFASRISTKNKSAHYLSIGGAYDNGVWLAQAEASYTNLDTHALPSQASAYLSIGRRFSTVTLYTLYGISHSLEDRLNIPAPIVPLPALEELQNILEYSLNQTGADQQSLSLGMRWDFYENIAFKMQWSHYWLGTRQGTAQWSNPLATNKPHNVNVWSLGVDFIF